MKNKYILFLIILALCAGCGQPPEAETDGESDQPAVSATRTGTQAKIESVTATLVPSLTTEATNIAESTATVPLATTELTLAVTATLPLSHTVVSSVTAIISGTWTYTEVRVTRSGRVHQVDWGKDGDTFAAATSMGAYIYDAQTLDVSQSIYVGGNVPSVLINSKNGLAAFGSLNGDIRWIDPETGRYVTTFKGHDLGVTDMVYPGQGFHLVSGSDDGTIRAWDPAFAIDPNRPGAPLSNVTRLNDRVICVDVNQNGDLFAAGTAQSWGVWHISSGEIVMEQVSSPTQIKDIAFSPNGEYLAVADGSNAMRLWKTSDWSLSHEVVFEEIDTITSIDFYRNQLMLVIGGWNGVVLQWDMTTNEYFEVTRMPAWGVSDIEIHPDGSSIMVSSENGYVRLVLNQ